MFSCHGIYHKWQQADDHWKIHAQYFPYCPHITYWKTKFYVKDILKQEPSAPQQYTMDFRFLKQHIHCLGIEHLRTELRQMINEDNTLALFQHISANYETLCKILQYLSKAQTTTTQRQTDYQINSLQQRIQCIICNDRDRNTLLLPCTYFIDCRECTLRFQNECPVCRAAVTQTALC